MKNTLLFLLAGIISLQASLFAALPVSDPGDGGLILPPGFHALIYADNLVVGKNVGRSHESLRGLAVAPNGDVYAKGMRGQIFALRDTNSDGRADVIEQFGPGDGGTHIMFHNGYLYHSSPKAVYRYKYITGELVPSSPLEVIVHDLPNNSGGHDQKAFAFDDSGHMIVEVGSPYNVFSHPDRQRGAKGGTPAEVAKFQETYGGFWQFDANETNQSFADGVRYATGIRHCLSLTWDSVSKSFFMCMMGRDQLNTVDPEDYDTLDNAERVSEEFHQLKRGVNIGWPYSYWDPYKNARMLAPEYGGDGRKRADNAEFDKPLIAFPAHWAPLQMCLYDGTQFPPHYHNGMFLAFHGSWNRAPLAQAGYKVVFIPFDDQGMPTGKWEDFAEGFPGVDYFVNTRDAKYRPCGVAVGPDGSLYISETEMGRIWRVFYTEGKALAKGENTHAVATEQNEATGSVKIPENKIYTEVCAACHMPDGRGVPNMQPPLAGSAVVAGDPNQLIKLVLKGPSAVLPANRPKYSNTMPEFDILDDEDIASVVNYVRDRFAPGSSKVTAEQVAAQRAKK